MLNPRFGMNPVPIPIWTCSSWKKRRLARPLSAGTQSLQAILPTRVGSGQLAPQKGHFSSRVILQGSVVNCLPECRNFRNIKRVMRQGLQRGRIEHRFLFTTDGFEMSEWAVKRLFLGVCIYGQVIKKHRESGPGESSSRGCRNPGSTRFSSYSVERDRIL